MRLCVCVHAFVVSICVICVSIRLRLIFGFILAPLSTHVSPHAEHASAKPVHMGMCMDMSYGQYHLVSHKDTDYIRVLVGAAIEPPYRVLCPP